jgi:AcrR family transcriptional regulator
MGRPATQHEAKKELIIEAAIECFSSYGFEGTTNKQIATAAGLNSAALIYHYFPSKEDLFKACLAHFTLMDELKLTLETTHYKDPKSYLTFVATEYMGFFKHSQLSKLIPMFIGSIQSHLDLVPILAERIQSVLWSPLGEYFEEKMDEGIIKRMPMAVALQLFLGPFIARVISPILLYSNIVFDRGPDDVFIENLVDTFLDGALVKK